MLKLCDVYIYYIFVNLVKFLKMFYFKYIIVKEIVRLLFNKNVIILRLYFFDCNIIDNDSKWICLLIFFFVIIRFDKVFCIYFFSCDMYVDLRIFIKIYVEISLY